MDKKMESTISSLGFIVLVTSQVSRPWCDAFWDDVS